MRIAKRIFLFLVTNILIIATITTVMSVLGLQPYLAANGINYTSLVVFCALWGFGAAFVSLALSRKMAKWMMGVKVIDSQTRDASLQDLLQRVHQLSRRAGLKNMPEVGVYDSPELNAFATGPTRNRSLVAVSTGLLNSMNRSEVEGVLAHEVAHVANGDMVTMTLVQGVVNAFVMFIARVAAYFASQFAEEENRPMVQFGMILAFEILLGILGMLVVAAFSRAREYRADRGGARLASSGDMIAALTALKRNSHLPTDDRAPALASLKISGRAGKLARLFSTHPDLDARIAQLQARENSPQRGTAAQVRFG